ncbi:MAG: SDR family oxidoreductase [Acidimicrobiia bacterium]
MRVLITGATGYLGTALAESIPPGIDAILAGFSRGTRPLDVTEPTSVAAALDRHRPNSVVHLAAVSTLAGAAGDPERATRVNVEGAGVVAAAARRAGARLVTLSSDVVFDGSSGPYHESSPANPINDYGRSKLEGEAAVLAAHPEALILRTTVLVGRDRAGRFPFSAFVLERAARGETIDLFENERRNFYPLTRAATAVWECATNDISGILHIGARSSASRYQFGRNLLEGAGFDGELAVAVQGPAERPADLTMDVDLAASVLDTPMPTMAEAIEETVRDLTMT